MIFKTKGQDILIKAFGKIAHKFPDVFLVFLGDGPDLAEAMRLAKDTWLSERVIFPGWRKDVLAIMAKSEVFILPSRYEGWPNVLVEAMACGRPVIATDCLTGPKEILDNGKYGILVPPEDPEALARSLELVLENTELHEKYEKLASERATVFEVSEISKKYIETIKQVTKQKNLK
jgi:glycosyltransferase involved in cell wall biosynthesis